VWWLTQNSAEPGASGSGAGGGGDVPQTQLPTAAPAVAAAPDDSGATDDSTVGGGETPTTQPAVSAPTQTVTQAPAQAPAQTQAEEPEPEPEPRQVPTRQPTQQPSRPPPTTQPAPAPQPATGRLTVQAQPFGRVFVDGRDIGDSPIANYELPVGRHILEIRKEGYQTVQDTVDIQVGATLRKSYRLRQGGL
jgi:outer membrane biosynthesis protein TonB